MKAPSRIATACDGSQFIVREVFSFPVWRQILKLHLFGQHSSYDLEILVRAIVSDLLDHFDSIGGEVIRQGLQERLAQLAAGAFWSACWIAALAWFVLASVIACRFRRRSIHYR